MRSAVVLAALIVSTAAFSRGDSEPRPVRPLPGAVAVLHPGEGLGAVSGGAGDAWVDDRWGSRLLRIDHRTGAVTARLDVQGRLALAEGAGSLWALESGGGYGRGLRGPLLRVDPRSNRVTARIPLPALGFGVVVADDGVWVWGPDRLMRVAEGRIATRIPVAFEDVGETTGFARLGVAAVITTADGHLVRFDAGTGRVLDSVRLPFTSPSLQLADADRIVVVAGGDVAAIDPDTNAVLWRTRLGFRVGTVVEAGGALWAHGANVRDAGDRVWKLDPASGAVLGRVLLPAFGTMGMAVIGDTIWVTTGSGRVLVLRR
ncbi:MAG TPA: PQQ-binding-like beta-propeller repeat protein [Solirubrobacteraceae bacterium]|nr:PQQ-binding-like beta-propeller repeat protein [Solirubrobacteraceae bacterium]